MAQQTRTKGIYRQLLSTKMVRQRRVGMLPETPALRHQGKSLSINVSIRMGEIKPCQEYAVHGVYA